MNFVHCTFIENYNSYRKGDGLFLDIVTAQTYIDNGLVLLSKDYVTHED
jgi:hypothetical protein